MKFSDDYTKAVSDFYWGYNYYEESSKEIRHIIENVPAKISKEDFINLLNDIKKDYLCSSRRFLVNYTKGLASNVNKDGSFDVEYNDKTYHFSGSDINTIRKMNAEERNRYVELLSLICSSKYSDAQCSDQKKQWIPIFRKAMLWEEGEKIIKKDDVLRISHGLGFTLAQMEEYLIRATDNDGMDYNNVDDLIDIFCFLYPPANDYEKAACLKRYYWEHYKESPVLEKPKQYTKLLEDSLPKLIADWEKDSSVPTEEKMMEWLFSQTPYINQVSNTAKAIYSDLAYFAFRLITDQNFIDEVGDEFLPDLINSWCSEYRLPDDFDSYKISDTILRCAADSFDNKRVRNKRLFWTLWRYITINDEGEVKTESIGASIPDLMNGKQPVTKADLLFMIWFICELMWSYTLEEPEFYDQLSDFWTISEDLLELANLPGFYAPHLLEQSFLMSLCISDGDETPFEIYENICEGINPVRKRNREKKKTADGSLDTKELRKLKESEIREDFRNNAIIWDGVEKMLLSHLLEHGSELGQYVFGVSGVSYYPNPSIVVSYPNEKTRSRFDVLSDDYTSDEAADGRLEYLYAIYLYLRDKCKAYHKKLKCRINYRKNCMIQILVFE